MTKITVLNGPSLNMLGIREPDVYGSSGYDDLCRMISSHAESSGCQVDFFQYDLQGEMVSCINKSSGISRGLIVNPGGYSHTSVAVMDAMIAFTGPVVEVHISQIHRREPFRHRMLTARGADAVISGAGFSGYLSAMDIILEMLRRNG